MADKRDWFEIFEKQRLFYRCYLSDFNFGAGHDKSD